MISIQFHRTFLTVIQEDRDKLSQIARKVSEGDMFHLKSYALNLEMAHFQSDSKVEMKFFQ